MVVFIDHNGKTTFADHVKTWTFEELETTFKGKHDLEKLAKALGIRVVKGGDPKPKLEVEKPISEGWKPKKKKED